jgi:hypothetical protein
MNLRQVNRIPSRWFLLLDLSALNNRNQHIFKIEKLLSIRPENDQAENAFFHSERMVQ